MINENLDFYKNKFEEYFGIEFPKEFDEGKLTHLLETLLFSKGFTLIVNPSHQDTIMYKYLIDGREGKEYPQRLSALMSFILENAYWYSDRIKSHLSSGCLTV